MTEYCWGEVWGDETLSPRERSILTLGMVAALGKMGEFANHVRGAQVNGLTPKELSAVLIQIAIYCGIPVGADCFHVAEEILRRARKAERLMSDHISGPRAIADPVIDITDLYAFPCPENPRHLVLIMNVFPYAGPSALFSDAVIYRFRVRPVSIAPGGRAFAVADEESVFDFTFSGAANDARGTLQAAKRRGGRISRE